MRQTPEPMILGIVGGGPLGQGPGTQDFIVESVKGGGCGGETINLPALRPSTCWGSPFYH